MPRPFGVKDYYLIVRESRPLATKHIPKVFWAKYHYGTSSECWPFECPTEKCPFWMYALCGKTSFCSKWEFRHSIRKKQKVSFWVHRRANACSSFKLIGILFCLSFARTECSWLLICFLWRACIMIWCHFRFKNIKFTSLKASISGVADDVSPHCILSVLFSFLSRFFCRGSLMRVS